MTLTKSELETLYRHACRELAGLALHIEITSGAKFLELKSLEARIQEIFEEYHRL